MSEKQSSRLGVFTGEDDRISASYSTIRSNGGEIRNIHKTLCHSPAMLRAQSTYVTALRGESSIPRVIQQLAILRVCQLNEGSYEWNVHFGVTTKMGVPATKVEALESWPQSDLFTAEEKVVLSFVDQTCKADGVSESVFQAAKAALGARGIIDLSALIAWYVGNTRFSRALEIALD